MKTSFEVSVIVPQNQSHAWEYYFNQTNGWWTKEFHTSPSTKRFTIDTYIGGHVYEDYGEGGGLIWGDVIGVKYNEWLLIRGNLSREFGGPAITMEKFSFEAYSTTETKVIYTCDFIGDIKEKSVQSLHDGWKEILNVHYKNYCLERKHD